MNNDNGCNTVFIKEINERCKILENKWKNSGYCAETFPDVVLETFSGFDLSRLSELKNLSSLMDLEEISCLQEPSSFSDLYFKIYDNGKFWIEILNWWGLDINIHDHNFTGVQYQLCGESLNVVYEFNERAILDQLSVGDFDIKRIELWRPGDHSIVRSGRSEPHNVIHLDIPTVSLLVRTYPRSELPNQNNYFPPSIRSDYSISTPSYRKKVAIIRLLSRSSKEEFFSEYVRIYSQLNNTERLFFLIKTIDILFSDENSDLVARLERVDDLSALGLFVSRYYLQANFYSTFLKRTRGLSRSEIYLVGALAATFDERSFNRVVERLKNIDQSVSPMMLSQIVDKLDDNSKPLFIQGLKMYSLNLEHITNQSTRTQKSCAGV
ncbi:hypothetical protein AS19_27780 [Alcanivorax sp. NBRC 101098]|uniref:hypothetical protein n=1 Tax=Alcanivorax sp. NBRC 101098 TaxID=1113728 RepID=UPI0004ABD854|nr:hypothetical protein [Alcanivorax sp. NBRC 101098]BAP15629.1 hypothetical protein AS19_27780 [Alcanivorax sp. NBRC 101098]